MHSTGYTVYELKNNKIWISNDKPMNNYCTSQKLSQKISKAILLNMLSMLGMGPQSHQETHPQNMENNRTRTKHTTKRKSVNHTTPRYMWFGPTMHTFTCKGDHLD